jgi:pseudouridine-5'-phosphate glycosidase
VPIPADKAADSDKMKSGIAQALKEADDQNVSGA